MNIKNELERNGFRFQKRYGQNFITDADFLASLVQKSGVEKIDTIVEIGAGAGTLTAALCAAAKKVIAYEIDSALIPVLERTLGGFDNVEIKACDFMNSEDITDSLGEYKVVANLPYYITTPVLFRLIEDSAVAPKAISVMVQKEVADRLCAKPGTKDYGALTVAIDYRYEAKKIIDVNRRMFYPVPNVDSAVVLMTERKKNTFVDATLFSKVVRSAFAMRRKTLANNLMATFALPRVDCEAAIAKVGLSLSVRGEALSTAQFVSLTATIAETSANRLTK